MDKRDAGKLGIKDGDSVRLVSPTNQEGAWDLEYGGKVPMVGKEKVIQGIRPGVVAFSLGHEHWSYGGRHVAVDLALGQTEQSGRRGYSAAATV